MSPKNKFVIKKTKVRIIGIGGGGGSIVAQLAKKIKQASFVAANTDTQALKKLPKKIYKFEFGQEFTHGLGTGMNPELARNAAHKEKQRIKKLLKGQDLCIFISCLGGGTGSGALPVFAELSKELGNINLGIFTLPFKFEGEKRNQIAREALIKVKPYLNALLVIQNQRIFRIIDKKSSLEDAFLAFNKILADNLASFIDLIYRPGLINIDFADFRNMIGKKGERFYFNTAEGKGANRTKEVLKQILDSPLFDFNIKTAKRILFNIAASPDLKMREVEEISNAFSMLNRRAKIIFGISSLPSTKRSGIKVTLLVTGDNKRRKSRSLKDIKKKEEVKEVKSEAEKEEKPEEQKKKKETIELVEESKEKKEIEEEVLSKEKVVEEKKKKQRKKSSRTSKKSKKKEKQKKRLSALEIKKLIQKEEEKRLAEEEKWEIPAFLRRSPWREKIKTLQSKKKK
ncbi:cell division FtsZ family protein [bacterium]|nr:cell division FtsZ family protein [bacterium]